MAEWNFSPLTKTQSRREKSAIEKLSFTRWNLLTHDWDRLSVSPGDSALRRDIFRSLSLSLSLSRFPSLARFPRRESRILRFINRHGRGLSGSDPRLSQFLSGQRSHAVVSLSECFGQFFVNERRARTVFIGWLLISRVRSAIRVWKETSEEDNVTS